MGGLLSALGRYLLALVQWFVGAVWNTLISFVSTMVGLLPQGWKQTGDSVVTWANYANYWVPLDYGVTLFGLYYGFLTGLLIYRVVKSFVPTVSG